MTKIHTKEVDVLRTEKSFDPGQVSKQRARICIMCPARRSHVSHSDKCFSMTGVYAAANAPEVASGVAALPPFCSTHTDNRSFCMQNSLSDRPTLALMIASLECRS